MQSPAIQASIPAPHKLLIDSQFTLPENEDVLARLTEQVAQIVGFGKLIFLTVRFGTELQRQTIKLCNVARAIIAIFCVAHI